MQLKTFSAPSSAAALAQIKAEFGAEAVILETREENGQVFMTAALERDGLAPARRAGTEEPGEEAARAGGSPRARAGKKTEQKDEAPSRSRPAGAARAGAAQKASLRATPLSAQGTESLLPTEASLSGMMRWQEEWNSIKGHLMALMQPALRLDKLPSRQRLALEYLQREGVRDEALLRLYGYLRDDPSANILGPLAELVPIRPWGEESWPQRLQLITGPFGAGKTSVAIRLALSLRRNSPHCRICLVNADATRGNGRLLLRHYCDLSDLVYKEASSTLELVAALNSAKREDYDRILVDMPGLARGAHLKALLADAGLADDYGESPEDAAVHLTLSPYYAGDELSGILGRYASRHAGSVIWTKLDEAEHYGQIVNVGAASGLPVSALSFGPGLGNSLLPAKGSMLWRLLFKHELPASI